MQANPRLDGNLNYDFLLCLIQPNPDSTNRHGRAECPHALRAAVCVTGSPHDAIQNNDIAGHTRDREDGTLRKAVKIFGMLGAVVALLAIHSTHWAALQAVAWGKMFVAFAQEDSLTSAIVRTFDGQHPCTLCLEVQEGIAQDQHSRESEAPAPASLGIGEALWEFNVALTPDRALASMEEHPCDLLLHSDFTHRPPSPPPRISVDA